jgi:hypothetical protein
METPRCVGMFTTNLRDASVLFNKIIKIVYGIPTHTTILPPPKIENKINMWITF